jgi:hypothetical protein
MGKTISQPEPRAFRWNSFEKNTRVGVDKRCGWNIIQEAPLAVGPNACQGALDAAIAEINKKMDLRCWHPNSDIGNTTSISTKPRVNNADLIRPEDPRWAQEADPQKRLDALLAVAKAAVGQYVVGAILTSAFFTQMAPAALAGSIGLVVLLCIPNMSRSSPFQTNGQF